MTVVLNTEVKNDTNNFTAKQEILIPFNQTSVTGNCNVTHADYEIIMEI